MLRVDADAGDIAFKDHVVVEDHLGGRDALDRADLFHAEGRKRLLDKERLASLLVNERLPGGIDRRDLLALGVETEHPVAAEGEVVTGDRDTIRPLEVGSQVPGDGHRIAIDPGGLGELVLHRRDRCCHIRDILQIRGHRDESGEDRGRDVRFSHLTNVGGVKGQSLLPVTKDERAANLALAGLICAITDRARGAATGDDQESPDQGERKELTLLHGCAPFTALL